MKRRSDGSSNNPSSKKPRRLPGFEFSSSEGEDREESSSPQTSAVYLDDDDYDCSPPEPDGAASAPGGLNFDNEGATSNKPPCISLPCKPSPYWEREIVKYDMNAKWDPNIKEKGNTGRPDFKGNNKSSHENGSGCNEAKVPYVPLGEACNAYRCYLDPSVPPGHAYCTLKHFKSKDSEAQAVCNHPPRFPMKPIRIQICRREVNSSIETRPVDDTFDINFSCENEIMPAKPGVQPANENTYNSGCPCTSDGVGFHSHGRENYHVELISEEETSGESDSGQERSNKTKIPNEWVMKLPSCNSKTNNASVARMRRNRKNVSKKRK